MVLQSVALMSGVFCYHPVEMPSLLWAAIYAIMDVQMAIYQAGEGTSMKVVQWGALLASVGLLAAAVLALASGDVLRQALLILSQPWGVVSLLDIAVGFLFV